MSRTVYRYDAASGRMVDKATGAPMNDPAAPWVPATPASRGDIEPYVSPGDGRTIVSGRAAARDDMAKHGCIDYREAWGDKPLGFNNPEFARKHGMPTRLING